jgi:hypothetical protein
VVQLQQAEVTYGAVITKSSCSVFKTMFVKENLAFLSSGASRLQPILASPDFRPLVQLEYQKPKAMH